MLLKEMNFRDIVDKYLYIEAAGVAQNLGSIFEVTEDATGVLCYGYIDAQEGISFEILCCAVYDAAKKTLKLLRGNDEQSAKIRLAELLEAQAAVLPGEMPRLSEFQSKVATVQKTYKADEATEAMRRLTSLDPARLATHPDIVTVYLVRGDEAEAVLVLLKEVREVNIIGTLLSEPETANGLHKGDEISFFLVRNEKGIMCMKVLEK
ncbi:hypothetical protein [uncultured Phascolarctobacterium sp.]|uniref:hypothetical protein n=1 Tax=uncultured Phascolarctobacterium sp. TaxID=512296 RepID=UPI0025E0E8BF|nr:hypothetical protein [uncultured Phascolarctobacterium sp.]